MCLEASLKKGTAKEEAEAEGERTGGATRGGGGVEGRIKENHVVIASGLQVAHPPCGHFADRRCTKKRISPVSRNIGIVSSSSKTTDWPAHKYATTSGS